MSPDDLRSERWSYRSSFRGWYYSSDDAHIHYYPSPDFSFSLPMSSLHFSTHNYGTRASIPTWTCAGAASCRRQSPAKLPSRRRPAAAWAAADLEGCNHTRCHRPTLATNRTSKDQILDWGLSPIVFRRTSVTNFSESMLNFLLPVLNKISFFIKLVLIDTIGFILKHLSDFKGLCVIFKRIIIPLIESFFRADY